MPSSAPSPKKKTSPVVWLALAAVVVGVYTFTSGGDESTATTAKTTKKKSSAKSDDLYTPADYAAKFAPVSATAADVFRPLIAKPVQAALTGTPAAGRGGVGGLDLALTGGEANWYYTGWAELDGVRQALLENSVSGETAYVGVGDSWKAARVQGIDAVSMTIAASNGTTFHVPIQRYDATPGASAAPARIAENATGGQPLNVPGAALSGTIGGIGVRPLGAGNSQAAVPNNDPNAPSVAQGQPAPNAINGGNANNSGRRFGRRNRNSNTTDNQGFNNVP